MKVSSLHPCLVFVCLLSTRSLLSNTIQDRRATPTPPTPGNGATHNGLYLPRSINN